MSVLRAPFSISLFFLGLFCLLPHCSSSSSLVGVILVSRHGTRAPNAVTTQLCPANSANLARYLSLNISLEGVTGRGMHQLLQLGHFTRKAYVDTAFLKPYYSNEEMYIRAVGEDRTLQSAVAWGQGLYPAGHAPVGYPDHLPSPLPVYTLPDELDVLLENRKAGCHQRLKADVQLWDDTTGAEMRRQYSALLSQLEELCGINLTHSVNGTGDNYGDAVKDITDDWTFDFIEHFPPLPGLTLTTLLQFRTYAVHQLIGRILGTPEQVTYLNGDLPLSMLRSFKAVIRHREGGGDEVQGVKPLKFIAYHGHREMMYALAAFFDIRYNITYPALPMGAIPPATSLFFELHSIDHTRHQKKKSKGKGKGKHEEEEEEEFGEDYEVRAVLWSPCDEEDIADPEHLVTADTDALAQGNISHPLNVTFVNHTRVPVHRNQTFTYRRSSEEVKVKVVKECGSRPIAISACEGGVCSFNEFRRVVHAQIHSTGDWRTLCAYDQRTGREHYDSSNRSDSKVPGAGRTVGDHSKSHQEDEPEEEAMKGEGPAPYHSSTGLGVEGEERGGMFRGWTAVVVALLASAVIGGLLYWRCFMRGDRRGEYQRV